MRFLVDMGIARSTVEWLKSQGHEAKLRAMCKLYGMDNWWHGAAPQDIKETCLKRFSEWRLGTNILASDVNMVDFTTLGEILKIIKNKNNWEKIFKKLFHKHFSICNYDTT